MEVTNPRPDTPLPESRFSVILVEPQGPDNVGHIARSMLNFGVSDLVLVNAEPWVVEGGRERAVHAQEVLNRARRFERLEDAKQEFDVLLGFAARISTLNKSHRRMSEPLEKVARRLTEMGGRIGLVFGREDFGLSNEDVETCDLLCTIPTHPVYRSMNLAHAVTVALYELSREEHAKIPYVTMAKPHEKEVIMATFRHLNENLGFKPHRVAQADLMFQRVLGRAGLTAWEYHRLMGTFSRALKHMGAWPPPKVRDGVEHDDDDDDADAGPDGAPESGGPAPDPSSRGPPT